jgi:hypothetical protein
MTAIDFATVVPAFDAILSRGLSNGIGDRDGQMCVEAAICAAMGLPHGDDPQCVAASVRSFKIRLNDSPRWPSPQARADGLRRLGIAQLGSKGVVDDGEFVRRIAEATISRLLPRLFRAVFHGNERCLAAALRCETEGTRDAAYAAAYAASADAASAAYAAAYAASADAASAAYAAASASAASADAASYAAAAFYAAANADSYLRLSADLAFQILVDLKSPGALWLLEHEGGQ